MHADRLLRTLRTRCLETPIRRGPGIRSSARVRRRDDATTDAAAAGDACRAPAELASLTWYLESYATESKSLWRLPLLEFPVRVGRRSGVGLSLLSPLISYDHAEINLRGRALRIRDLGSTNGTFVNGRRVDSRRAMRLKEGDILHFANAEFRLGRLAPGESAAQLKTRTAMHFDVPRQLIDNARHLHQLLRRRAVISTMQPIVRLHDGEVFGYELLGRGASKRLPQSPQALFELAATLGVAGELSRLFRAAGARRLRRVPKQPVFFFNTHPAELEKPGLIDSLRALRRELPTRRLALEIHEQAATHPDVVHALRRALALLDIELAYDDFGAGRSRINELIEVPPDYLKFDETLIRGIDRAPASKRRLLRALLRMCREGEIRTLAEGVETESEAGTLRDLGFDLAQGYLFGKPKPLTAKAATGSRQDHRRGRRRKSVPARKSRRSRKA